MNLSFSCESPQIQQSNHERVRGDLTDIHRLAANGGTVHPIVQDRPSVLSGWEVLPNELLCNILKELPFHDLLPCHRLNQRTAEVIRDNLLLPQAYWKQFQPEPVEEYFTAEAYNREVRSWLMEAGKSSEVLWLDSLTPRKIFPQVLFYTVSKTMGQAEYWELERKLQVKLNQNVQLLDPFACEHYKITLDGHALAFIDKSERTLHIMAIRGGDPSVEDCQIALDLNAPHSLTFSPNSHILAVASEYGAVCLIEKEQNGWTKKELIDSPQLDQNANVIRLVTMEFSCDSRHLLTTLTSGTIRVMVKQDGYWVAKMENDTQCFIQSARFVPGLPIIALTCWHAGLTIMDVENNRLVAQYRDMDFVHQVSLCGCSLAVGSRKTLSAVITFNRGQWRIYRIPPKQGEVSCTQFSPDGQHFAFALEKYASCEEVQSSINVISFDGTNWRESGEAEGRSQAHYICFGPDSRSFFVSLSTHPTKLSQECPLIPAVLVDGCWQFHNIRHYASMEAVRPTLMSPDGHAAIDGNYGCIISSSRTLLRNRAGVWSAAHKIKGSTPWRVKFFPDNRSLSLIFGSEIQLLEIKPKNSSCPLAKGLA